MKENMWWLSDIVYIYIVCVCGYILKVFNFMEAAVASYKQHKQHKRYGNPHVAVQSVVRNCFNTITMRFSWQNVVINRIINFA